MKKSSRIVLAAVIFALLVFAAGAVLMLAKGHNDAQAREKTVFAMDTACTAKTWGADPAKICDEITRLDSVFDSHNEKSEISQLNRSGSGKLSEDMKTFLEQSVALTEKYPDADISVGAVTKLWNVTGKDPKVPKDEDIAIALKTCGYENITLEGSSCTLKNGAQLDAGAAAKGYALDAAKKVLKKDGAQCAVVTMGSSSLLYGKKPDGKDFSVAVKDPESPDGMLLKFTCGECFVSTSGGYERYFEADGKRYIHIFDKTTGRPVQTDLTSVTVICDGGLKSDQLSTSVFIGGTKKLGEYFADKSLQLIAVDTQGNVHISSSLENRITLQKSGHKIIVEK